MFPDPTLAALVDTVVLGLRSTLVAVAVGLPLGWLARPVLLTSSVARWLLLAPMAWSSIVICLGWQAILGPIGPAIAMGLASSPWVALGLGYTPGLETWTSLARTLGTGPRQAWVWVAFPLLARALVALSAQVFLWSLTSLTAVLLLGGGPPLETLELQIYLGLKAHWDPGRAGAAALAQAALAGLVVVAVARPRRAAGWAFQALGSRPKPGGARLAVAWMVCGLGWLPLTAVRWSWDVLRWEALAAAGRSAGVALGASIVVALMTMILLRSPRWVRGWQVLGAVSPLALGVLFYLGLGGLSATTAVGVLVALHSIALGGWVAAGAADAAERISHEALEVASTLGLGRLAQRRWIEWPWIRRQLGAPLGVVLALSLGEVSLSTVFSPSETPGWGAYLMGLAGSYQWDAALALGALGSVFSSAVAGLLWRLGGNVRPVT